MRTSIKKVILLCSFIMMLILLCSCDTCLHFNMQETHVDATCTNAGKVIHTCVDCEYSYIDNIIEPTGHKYTEKVTEPTCDLGGYTTYECACGHSYVSDYTNALGHDYSKEFYTIAPTCMDQGYTYYSCSRCDHSYTTDYIKPNGHEYEKTVVAPTCTSEGYTSYDCQNCEYAFTSDYKAVLSHEMTPTVTDPTCTNQGYTTYKCENCEYSYVSDITDPTNHEYKITGQTSPTCIETGETVYTCDCGDTYTVIHGATGHEFTTLVTAPSLSDMGYTDFTCVICSYSYAGDYRFYSDLLPNGAFADNKDVLAQGVDVSIYNYGTNESIDFAALKAAGIDYVIIKAGSSYRDNFTKGGMDKLFEKTYADAKAAGLDVGVYFYTYATTVNEIVLDARFLLSILDEKQFEYPIYLDLEDDSLASIDSATLTQMCVEFFTILQRSGYYTGLYVNDTWLTEKINTEYALSLFEIWYAYHVDPVDGKYTWNVEKFGFEELGMWQYSDNGSFEAIGDIPFDLNFSYKDYPTIIKQGGFNGYGENIRFIDDDKTFVYIIAEALNVRLTPDFSSEANNIKGTAHKYSCYEVLETTDEYVKIIFNGQTAYIRNRTDLISFEPPYPINQ